MSILSTFSAIIGLVDKTMGLIPDYDSKKRLEWVAMKREYYKQKNLELDKRDADLILNLKDSILLFANDIIKKK